jgi:nucleoside-diphosphate-sugar epimerase
MMPMRIIVTGGTGFIGSNLIPELQKQEHEVYNLERYVTGRYNGEKSCPTVFADLRDGYAIRKIIKNIDPEIVIHTAAISAVSYSYDHPQEVIENNFIGTINLAESCLRESNNFKQFLFAGTSEEYGNNGYDIQFETNPLSPASPYAISKMACERYLRYMVEAYDFPITILRPFNTFGRRNDTHFLIESTIVQMLTKKAVKLVDPTPVRDWMYVADHVSAYIACIGSRTSIGETFNFCTGKGFTVRDTVDKIAELIGYDAQIKWGSAPGRPTESKIIVGNNDKAKKTLGWAPKYTLDEGLQETIKYWENKLQ